jgi:hypothetical protein
MKTLVTLLLFLAVVAVCMLTAFPTSGGQECWLDKWGHCWPTYDLAWCANQGTPWDQCWAYSTSGDDDA